MRVTFNFDPGCPWTWVTSRWLLQAAAEEGFELAWSPLSLRHLHAGDDDADTEHDSPAEATRVVQHLIGRGDHDAAGRFYAAYGRLAHIDGREQAAALVGVAITIAELDEGAVAAAGDAALDAVVGAATDTAVASAGGRVGSPVLSWVESDGRMVAAFGPILAAVPADGTCGPLWQGVRAVVASPTFHELKRGGRPHSPRALESPSMTDGTDHLRINVDTSATPSRITLDGELDVHTAPDLVAAIDKALEAGAGPVVVDATALKFCDSSGIQALVQGRDRVADAGGSLTLEGVHGAVEKVLVVTGVLDLFTA